MNCLYSNGSVISLAWLFNDRSKCESLKHFYIKFYDIYDGIGGVQAVGSKRKNMVERRVCGEI